MRPSKASRKTSRFIVPHMLYIFVTHHVNVGLCQEKIHLLLSGIHVQRLACHPDVKMEFERRQTSLGIITDSKAH